MAARKAEPETNTEPTPEGPLEPVGKRFELGRTRRAVLTFKQIDDRPGIPSFQAVPQLPFRPIGLIIWGAGPTATVDVFVGRNSQGDAGFQGMPARFFGSGDNFEQIKKLLDAGKEPPAWIEWDYCDVGHFVTVRFRDANAGDQISICMWGHAKVG